MNKPLMRHELSKMLRCPAFILALALAVAIAVVAAVEPWINLKSEISELMSFGYQTGLKANSYLGQTRESSFGNWIVVSANAPLSASVFFYVLPLLTLLAGSWSYLAERQNGYDAQVCTRVSRNSYVNAKLLSSFLSAFIVVVVSLAVNFAVVSMLFPAYMPRVDETTYVGLYLHSYFSYLFYTPPFLYVAVYTLFDAVTLGALSMAVTGLSLVFRSQIKAVIVPYLIMVAWHFVNDWLFSIMECIGFNCNILNSMRSESSNNWPDIRAGIAEVILLFAVSLVLARALKRREVV